MVNNILTFDLGGTTIKYGIVNDQYNITNIGSFPTIKDDRNLLLKQLYAVIDSVRDKINGISCALPGRIDSQNGVVYEAGAITCLENCSLGKLLAEKSKLPVKIENDGGCVAIAEHTIGAAQNKQNVIFIILGTGIGGAIVCNGKLLTTNHFFNSEFGYMILNKETAWDDLEGPVVATIHRIKKEHPEYVELSGKEIFDCYHIDPVITPYLERFYSMLGSAIYSLQMIFDPDLFVIGGGISQRVDLISNIQEKIAELSSKAPIPFLPEISLAKFGNEANLLGAYFNLTREMKV